MKRNISRIVYCPLIFIFSFCLGEKIFAQTIPLRDTAFISNRSFNGEIIRDFKSDSEFNYETTIEPAGSLWTRFWDFVWRLFRQIFSATGGGTTFKWGLRLLAIAVLAFFIWQLTRMGAAGMFSSAKGRGMNYTVSDEDIHSIDFTKEISEAVVNGDYRLAVRLLYLQTLKKLSDAGVINWRIDKTNLSYLNEVRQAEFYQQFRKLTIQFENNWYGNIPISSEEYGEVADEFKSLYNQVKK